MTKSDQVSLRPPKPCLNCKKRKLRCALTAPGSKSCALCEFYSRECIFPEVIPKVPKVSKESKQKKARANNKPWATAPLFSIAPKSKKENNGTSPENIIIASTNSGPSPNETISAPANISEDLQFNHDIVGNFE